MRLGIDLGGTNIAVGLVNEDATLVAKLSAPTPVNDGADAIVAKMAALCHSLMSENALTEKDITLCGIAAPGYANPESGEIEVSANLPFFRYNIVNSLAKHLPGVKIMLENDANAAAKGEVEAGAAKGASHAIMITLGTGVGGGIIIHNKIYSGFNFAGGELGHIVIEHDGEKCGCGRKGCWETYSSATALIRMTKEKMEKCPDSLMHDFAAKEGKVSGRTSFSCAKQGDKAAQEVVDAYIRYLACGLTNIINIFQPEIIVIGGGISGERDNLLTPLRALVEIEQYTSSVSLKTQLLIAALGNDAGIIGAALLDR